MSHIVQAGSQSQAASDSRLESDGGTMAANYTKPEKIGKELCPQSSPSL